MGRSFECQPQSCAHSSRIGRFETIEHHDTLDHVGDHCRKRSTLHSDSDDSGDIVSGKSAHGAIDPDDSWRTTKPWRYQTESSRLGGNHSRNGRKLSGVEGRKSRVHGTAHHHMGVQRSTPSLQLPNRAHARRSTTQPDAAGGG